MSSKKRLDKISKVIRNLSGWINSLSIFKRGTAIFFMFIFWSHCKWAMDVLSDELQIVIYLGTINALTGVISGLLSVNNDKK